MHSIRRRKENDSFNFLEQKGNEDEERKVYPRKDKMMDKEMKNFEKREFKELKKIKESNWIDDLSILLFLKKVKSQK